MKQITRKEEIELLEKLFDSDSIFAMTFAEVKDAMIKAVKDDCGDILMYAKLENIGLCRLKRYDELGLKLVDIKEQLKSKENELKAIKDEKSKLEKEFEELKSNAKLLQLQYRMLNSYFKMDELKIRILKDKDYQLTDDDKKFLVSFSGC
ncbi:MAG: hypothetical protein MJZ87_00445 [Bacteroidales bacterium]|nr:hypothetical protein [Bacteroidales bacterium]